MNGIIKNILLSEDENIIFYSYDMLFNVRIDNKSCIYEQMYERGFQLTPGTCMSYAYKIGKKNLIFLVSIIQFLLYFSRKVL